MLDSADIWVEPVTGRRSKPSRKVRYEQVSAGGVRRFAIFQHPTSSITFVDLQLKKNPRVRFYLAIRDRSWQRGSDGVGFSVSVVIDGQEELVYRRVLEPAANEQDRGWVKQEVSLEKYSEQTVAVVLRTDPGPRKNKGFDHAFWGEPVIVTEATSSSSLPNVILLSLDTLRADNLGTYGHPDEISQNVDALASAGSVFESCVSQSSWTRPGHYAMLASRYPGRNLLLYDEDDCRISSDVVSIAESLKENDYLTAAFVGGGYVGAGSGFEQGFDYFKSYGRRFEPNLQPALEWLDEHAQSRFFLFLHNYNAHTPYDPPADARARFVHDPPAACEGVTFGRAEVKSGKVRRCQKDPGGASYSKSVYAAEVFNVDRLFGEVVAHLKRLEIIDRTIFIVTSDHGEGLYDHGEAGHVTSAYQELIRVPLILSGPGVPSGVRVDDAVQLIDIAPTVLDLLGLEIPGDFQGRSLVPLLEGSSLPSRHAFSASSWDRSLDFVRRKPHSITAATVHDGKKLIRNIGEAVNETEFYNIEVDPRERSKLEGGDVAWSEDLDRALSRWLRQLSSQADCQKTAMDPAKAEELRALGYLE